MVNPQSAISLPSLAAALDVDAESSNSWQAAELAAMLDHQLAAPIRDDLIKISPDLGRRFDAANGDAPASLTFAQLFAQASPSVELLRVVKDFSKLAVANKGGMLPEEMGAVLYCASYSCASLRCGESICSLDNHAMRVGLTWVIEQAWVNEAIKHLAREHLARLNGSAT